MPTKTTIKKSVAPKATHKTAVKVAGPALAVKPVVKEEAASRIRIKIRAYDNRIIDQATKTIVETAERHDAKVVGPVPLPTEKVRFTVNRSTFVHKDSREQFEMRVHKRLIDIMNPSPKVIEALTNLNLPSGVTIDVKMV